MTHNKQAAEKMDAAELNSKCRGIVEQLEGEGATAFQAKQNRPYVRYFALDFFVDFTDREVETFTPEQVKNRIFHKIKKYMEAKSCEQSNQAGQDD